MAVAPMDTLMKGCSSMPSFFTQYKTHFIIVAIIMALLAVYFVAKSDSQPETWNQPPIESSPVVEAATTPSKNEQPMQKPPHEQQPVTEIIVDVKGAVKKPGIYRLQEDARVKDAIDEAGGYTASANSKFINHAAKLQDEMVIYVTKKGEKMPEQFSTIPPSTQSNPTITKNDEGQQQPLVNLNTADETELQTLSGIGPAKAAAIIAHRTNNGPFESIEDLKKVSGFGEKTFERLQPSITVQ